MSLDRWSHPDRSAFVAQRRAQITDELARQVVSVMDRLDDLLAAGAAAVGIRPSQMLAWTDGWHGPLADLLVRNLLLTRALGTADALEVAAQALATPGLSVEAAVLALRRSADQIRVEALLT